jgi:hypothetical protein
MRSTTKVLFVAAACLTACGGSPASSDQGASAQTTETFSPSVSIKTDLGNQLFVDFVVDPPTGAGFASPTLVFEYVDKSNAFHRALAIEGKAVVHKSDGTTASDTVALVNSLGTPSGTDPIRYRGIFIVGDTLLAGVDLDIANDGKADGSKGYHVDFDHSDTECAVVLRDVKAPDFSTTPSGRFYTWTGTVDVSNKVLKDGAVGVQWHSSLADASSELVTKRVAGAPSGFVRFEFELSHDTLPNAGLDDTALRMFQMSLIPFVNLPNGTRLFDHNRLPDPQSYVLWSGDTAGGLVNPPSDAEIGVGFGIKDDSRVCR